MIQIDVSLVIQIVNFLFLIWALNLVLFRPIRNILIQRSEKMADLAQGIDSINRDARDKEDAFSVGIRRAREEGLKERDLMVAAAAEEEKQMIAKIHDKSQSELAAIRAKISEDAQAVKQSLEQEIDEFAKAIGQKILGRTV